MPAVWIDGQRTLLALPAGTAFLQFANANRQGWLAGTAWDAAMTTGQAWVWKPLPPPGGVQAAALGTLPGLAGSQAAGIDDQGRVVGLSSTWFWPADPFVWTETGGMTSLTAAGHVAEAPFAISPSGVVATRGYTYTLGNPASTRAVAPAPAGFNATTAAGAVVNDAGTRATFLLTTTSSPQAYPFRYADGSGWQQVSALVSGTSSRFGVGAIDAQGSVTATVQNSIGGIADGPAGTLVPLTSRLSGAYPESTVAAAGDQADDGSIVASTSIGRSLRLTRLVPVQPCASGCLRAGALTMTGRMISERGKPGQCTPKASNRASASLTVTDELGVPLAGATVEGRFLDDYYLDSRVSLRTDAQGRVTALHQGPACVGAIAFLVERVTLAGRRFDRTTGQLAGYVIPQP